MSKIKLFIIFLALKYRWKHRIFADLYREETWRVILKEVEKLDINMKDIKFK